MSSITTVSTSSSFGPTSRAGGYDTVLLTTDDTLFYVQRSTLSRVSVNAFRSVMDQPGSIIAGCNDAVKRIQESSTTLDVLLHAIYRIPYTEQTSPDVQVLLEAVRSMRRYDLEPALYLTPTNPFYSSLIRLAPSAPFDLYVLAAEYNLEHLAVTASSHLLSLSLSEISDEVAVKIGAIYIKRLLSLQDERMKLLKQIMFTPPTSHPPAQGCDPASQVKLTTAWIMAAADLSWDAKPDLAVDRIRNSFGSLRQTIGCHLCQEVFENRLQDVIRSWVNARRTI